MKYLILLSLLATNPSFAADNTSASTSQQTTAENLVKDLYTTQKELINPFQETVVCFGKKCRHSSDKQRAKPNKYLDVASLYTESFKANTQLTQLHFMIISTERNSIAMMGSAPTVTSTKTSENTYKVIVKRNPNAKPVISHEVICNETCLINGIYREEN